MSSGVSRVRTGSFNGTGSLLEVRTVGFRPQRVTLLNVDGTVTGEWQLGMPDDSVAKRITAGTLSVPSANGVIPLSDGFSLGTDTDLNVAAERVYWTAYE